jgi:hypothetical protein
MIEVVLQVEVVRADLVDDLHRLGRAVHEEAGMSRVLTGSSSSLIPASASLGAA